MSILTTFVVMTALVCASLAESSSHGRGSQRSSHGASIRDANYGGGGHGGSSGIVHAQLVGRHSSTTGGSAGGTYKSEHQGPNIIRFQLVGRHTSTTGGNVVSGGSYKSAPRIPTIIRAQLVGRHTSTTGGSIGSVGRRYNKIKPKGGSIIPFQLVGKHTSSSDIRY
ncbi:hypothetical protein OTU49_003559 [Cherax quadricarinatus]|uniref:Secreted protein n=1 Tax=Cherax quadricarinatus TaxID=27406 RepID=A0AAW0XMN8_CHEQU